MYYLEGATLEAIKTLFNKELKDAKNQLHNATKMLKNGDTKNAIKNIKSAREKFVKIYEKLASVKQGPISFITSTLIYDFFSPIATFKNLLDMSPSGKVILLSTQLLSTMTALLTHLRITPGGEIGVGGNLSFRLVSNKTIKLLNSIKGSSELRKLLYNKSLPNKNLLENDDFSKKAGLWNSCQRDMLTILKLYISTCDEIIKDIENGNIVKQ